jgi:hypothetical protein
MPQIEHTFYCMTTNPTSAPTTARPIPPADGPAVSADGPGVAAGDGHTPGAASSQAMPPRPPLPCLPPDVELAGGPEATLERIADIADVRDRLAAQLVVAVADIDGLAPELFADLSPQVWLEQTCRMTSRRPAPCWPPPTP